jgi:hypothetical protein
MVTWEEQETLAVEHDADVQFLPLVLRAMLEHGRKPLDATLRQIITDIDAAPDPGSEFEAAYGAELLRVKEARKHYNRVVNGAAGRLATLCLGHRRPPPPPVVTSLAERRKVRTTAG